jgi:hypothetical protein
MVVTVVKRGPWTKADILKVTQGESEAILKDFSGKIRLVRLLGRRQLRRERRALRRLEGLPGVPVDLGDVPPWGLLMEPIEGEPITRWRRRPREEILPMLERLARLVDRIHERGVAHLDLRKRDNILVSAEGVPSIIDFNASFCFDPGSLGARLVFPVLRRVDRAALLKWKSHLVPDLLTPAERRRHRRMSLLRRLWIFN